MLSWLAALVALGLCAAWFQAEARGRQRWQSVPRCLSKAGPDGGPYRPAPSLPVMLERAPANV